MIDEIVKLRRENPGGTRLVIPASRASEFMQAVHDVQKHFGKREEIESIEVFMGLNVRLGGGERVLVQ